MDNTNKKTTHTYSRAYLSIGHLKNAAHFSRLTGEVEQCKKFIWGVIKPHEAYAMGAVLSAAAFVESTINEIYADAADNSAPSEILRRVGTGYAHGMPENLRLLLASLWNTEKFQMTARTLEKYQTALKLAGKEEFKRGENPYQDTNLLIQLRNALVHFKPESHHETDTEPKELEVKLRAKFPLNPLEPDKPTVPFLTHRCLGYGCALWATKSSIALTDEFFSRMGLKAIYGDELGKLAIDYASINSLEEIAARYNTKVEHLVEHPADS